MAVDHAQRARWASRVLRLRQAGYGLGLEDTQSTAEMSKEGFNDIDDVHTIGAVGNPLTALISSFDDLKDDDKYVAGLFDKSIEELVKESRSQTEQAHEQMVSHVDQLHPATITMSQDEVNACYESQDNDTAAYQADAEAMLNSGDWPVPHRLGHGFAMQKERNA